MTEDHMACRPSFTFLSEEDKARIHRTSLDILSDIGMQIFHDGALDILQDAGCTADGDRIVRIPPELVEKAVETAPDNISIYSREGEPAMELGGYRSYFGTGSDLMYAMDAETRQRRLVSLEDVKRAARVADALPNIDFVMSFAHSAEISAHKVNLVNFRIMAENSVKPIVCIAEGVKELNEMWEMARTLRGSEADLTARPCFIQYAEPVSPLKHPFDSVDKLIYCAEKGLPVIYSPAPIAGSTAPMSIAGHIAQGLAECFCGLVIHQQKAPGAPFIMGMGPAVLDMATTQCSYNAPEYYMGYMGMIEMAHFYDLPSWGYAGTSDSQIPDEQAVFEAGISSFLSAMSGANLNHDVGYLNFGLSGSLEMVVVSDELIDQCRRIRRGIPVNADTLGLDVIREVGHTGHFLTHMHTLKHLRPTQWRPRLFSRAGYEQWEREGKQSLMERASARLKVILDTHEPVPLSEEKKAELRAREAAFEA
ncbi:trimethylamine methyltransferase [Desulfonema ishimotonii]|uniref:Trimethylamine methyltransferase n=1 Tax=Desulfonema ishimotonii TaxID=45657 RepID=A0A401FYR5_9BACT|nr:trimethylamine methyltransferase family protein [Desulfonema ishimotonii]GBC62111.1 trimethylamine methyltransferase [Desulfonema ishimotonii]